MVDTYISDDVELWTYKRRLKYLNDEMRYYIEVVQSIEKEMESYNRLIHDLAVDMQDYTQLQDFEVNKETEKKFKKENPPHCKKCGELMEPSSYGNYSSFFWRCPACLCWGGLVKEDNYIESGRTDRM